MPLQPGTRLGPYEISALLGAGGMGEVYRARDTRLDRLVAIKVLAPELAAAGSFNERFDREARSIAALSHPNICTLHDVGRQDGVDFLVMEYLDGETLAARLARQVSSGGRRASLPLDEMLRIGTELADALAAAHRAAIVHRDLKPGNVMLTKRGAKVLDFGLAKLGAGLVGDMHAHSATSTRPLTGIGALVGTLPYMAPEQLEGRDVDARTDIFALGSILYEMAAGRRPFSGESQASLIAAILDREPEPISQIDALTPPGLDRLVRKCLAKDPEARWQGASDVADELRWIASGSGAAVAATPVLVSRQGRSRVRLLWAAAITVLALAASGSAVMWLSRQPPSPSSDARHVQASFDGNVLSAAISPDGRSVAYTAARGLDDFRIFVRDLAAGQPLEIWKGRGVQQLAWLPDGLQLVVAASWEGTGGLSDCPTAWRRASAGSGQRSLPRALAGRIRAGGLGMVRGWLSDRFSRRRRAQPGPRTAPGHPPGGVDEGRSHRSARRREGRTMGGVDRVADGIGCAGNPLQPRRAARALLVACHRRALCHPAARAGSGPAAAACVGPARGSAPGSVGRSVALRNRLLHRQRLQRLG